MTAPKRFSALLLLVCLGGCASLAGVGDYEIDPCFGGTCPDGSVQPDASLTDAAGPTPDASVDAPATPDAVPDGPPPSPGLSSVALTGTGVAVGKSAIVTLTAKNSTGDPALRVGANVTFTASGGTSVVSFGPVTDVGGGVYRATVTGVTEGTKILVSAILDGAPLTTPGASFRVVNPVSAGLTFSLDAADADRAGNFGGKGCAAAGLTTWTDLTTNAFAGVLTGFGATTCAAGSGWAGQGTIESPYRLALDGVDDHVLFGNVNSLTKQTILVWLRKTGNGFAATSGTGGLTGAIPIVAKGAAQSENDPTIDIDYFLALASTGQLATDFEADPGSANAPLTGTTVLANDTWYMVGMTLDSDANARALWLDGAQDATSTVVSIPASGSAAPLVVGGSRRTTDVAATCPGASGSTGCGRFQGDIAVVRTYDRALTQAEIEKCCHAFSARFGMMTCPN